MVTRLNMIIFMQQDLSAAVDFYEKLGLTKVFHLKDKWAEFELGSTKLGLCPTSAEKRQIRTGVVLEVADLKAVYEALQEQADMIGEPIERPHGMMVSMQDPGGNIIDLYQPTPEKLHEFVQNTIKKQEQEDECCRPKVDAPVGCCKNKPEKQA